MADTIEADLLDALTEIPRHPEIYSGIVDKVDQMIAAVFNTDEAERAAQMKRVNLAGKLNRLQELYVDGDIERAAYQSRKSVIEAEIAKIEASIQVEIPRNLRSVANQIVENLGDIASATPQTQKDIVRSVIERVEITQQQITGVTPTAWAQPFFLA